MVIGNALTLIPTVFLSNSVRIIESEPWRATSLRTQDECIADAMGPLRGFVRAPDRKLRDDPWSHLKFRTIENHKRLMLVCIVSTHMLT